MKRKNIYVIVSLLMSLLVCGCLSGCNKNTEEEMALLREISSTCSSNPITFSNYIMDFSYSDTALNMNCSIWTDSDNARQYCEGNAYIKIKKQSLNEDMIMYTNQDENIISNYSYSLLTNKWTYNADVYDTSQHATQAHFGDSGFLSLSQLKDASLDWNTALIDAKETYIVHYVLKGSDIQALLDTTGLVSSDTTNINMNIFSQYIFPIKYYIDTQTKLLVRMEISIEAKPQEETFFEKLTQDDDIVLPPFTMIIKDISYEKQAVPAVPEEIKEEYGPSNNVSQTDDVDSSSESDSTATETSDEDTAEENSAESQQSIIEKDDSISYPLRKFTRKK